MSRRTWSFMALCVLCVGIAGGLGVLREKSSSQLVNPAPEPYRPHAPTSCAAWLGDELVTTFSDGGRAVESAEGVRVRNLSGAGWVQELPDGRVIAVVAGEAPALVGEVAPGLVVVTSPDPVFALLAEGGRAVWVPGDSDDPVRALVWVAVDPSTTGAQVVSLPKGTVRVHGVLSDGTFLVAGVLGSLTRARDNGEVMPIPEAVRSLTGPATEDGIWLTSMERGEASLVEVNWANPPTVGRRAVLPGPPVRVRADADGPVALVSGAEGRLSLWWLDARGEHTLELPWAVEDGCLALRGARVGVVAQGRAWAVDRRTGAAWTP